MTLTSPVPDVVDLPVASLVAGGLLFGAGMILGASLLTARGIPTTGEYELRTTVAQLATQVAATRSAMPRRCTAASGADPDDSSGSPSSSTRSPISLPSTRGSRKAFARKAISALRVA